MASALILILLEFFMILFLVLGYLIRFRGRVDFIAGFREGRIQDESGLTRFLGTNLLVLGIIAAGVFGLVLAFPAQEVLLFLIFAAIIVTAISIISGIGSRKYLKKQGG